MSVSSGQSSGGGKSGLIVLAILLAIFAAFGYLYYFGYFGFPLARIASIMDNNTAAAATTTTTSITTTTVVVTTTTTVTRTVTVTAAGFPEINVGSFEASGVVGGVKNALSGLFVWLLGNSLMDALFNLGIVIVLLILVYAAMKFVKYIAIFIGVVGVMLIVLRYILGVI
jgi:hypothetical protein